jgi:prepilin-type processing-associated H-X9-DG protein
MNELSPSSSGHEARALLSEVLSGSRQNIADVARELGLTTLDVARGVVSYALSSPQTFESESTLRHFGLTRDDFDTATLLASAEWEDEVVLAEGLSQVYEQFPVLRTALAQLARVLAGPGATATPPATLIAQIFESQDQAYDRFMRNATLELVQLIPAGFENVVLEAIERRGNPGAAIPHRNMQHPADRLQGAERVESSKQVLAAARSGGAAPRRGAFGSIELLEYALGGFHVEAVEERERGRPEDSCAREQEIVSRLSRSLAMLLDDGDACEPPLGLATRTMAFVAANGSRRHPRYLTTFRVPFRLADLGVAAAIFIAGLITLLPAIQRSRERMNQAGCVFNLQQLGIAFAQYGSIFREYPFLPDGYNSLPTGSFAAILHDAGLLHDLNTLDCPSKSHHKTTSLASFDEIVASRETDAERSPLRLFVDYAYNVSYRDTSGRVNPIRADLTGMVPLLADQPDSPDDIRILAGNSPNHGGQGQNVLFSDGHVSWYSTRRISPYDDDMFLNADKEVAPGLTKQDTALFPKNVPFRGTGAR